MRYVLEKWNEFRGKSYTTSIKLLRQHIRKKFYL